MSLELNAWQKCMSARVMSNAQYFKMACKKNAISKLLTSFFINVSHITLEDQLLLFWVVTFYVFLCLIVECKRIFIQDIWTERRDKIIFCRRFQFIFTWPAPNYCKTWLKNDIYVNDRGITYGRFMIAWNKEVNATLLYRLQYILINHTGIYCRTVTLKWALFLDTNITKRIMNLYLRY